MKNQTIEQLEDQRQDLDNQVAILCDFIREGQYDLLPEEERNRIQRQFTYVNLFLDVLDERIEFMTRVRQTKESGIP